MTVQSCGIDHEHRCIVGREPECGCIGVVSVLTHHEAYAYKDALDAVKDGLAVTEMTVDEFRALPWTCDAHKPDGPPWWRGNGGNGKRPAAVTGVLGL